MNKIKEIIGSEYQIHNLKPLTKRIRRALKPSHERQPLVKLVVAQSGKQFKLLCVEQDNNHAMIELQHTLPILEQLDFIPNKVYSDDLQILIEYIDGEFPKVESTAFAAAFGQKLAQVHNLGVGYVSVETIASNARKDLDFLVEQHLISQKNRKALEDRLLELAPQKIRTSLVYADLKPKNFVWKDKDQLFFIDYGAFQRNMITDQALFESNLYKRMNREVFQQSYLEAGGDEFLFENKNFSLMFNLIYICAYQMQKYHSHRFYEWKVKKTRGTHARALAKQLEDFLNSK